MATHGNFFTEKTPTGLVIAQTVGITASVYLLGEFSYSEVEADESFYLLEPDDDSINQYVLGQAPTLLSPSSVSLLSCKRLLLWQ